MMEKQGLSNGGDGAKKSPGAAILIGALGVVFGDIGTSPLYNIKAPLSGYGIPDDEHILGVLSILFWLLMLVASLKYITLVLRAAHRDRKSVALGKSVSVRVDHGGRRTIKTKCSTNHYQHT